MITIAVIVTVVVLALVACALLGAIARVAIVLLAAAALVVWAEPELAARAMAAAKQEVVKVAPEAKSWLP